MKTKSFPLMLLDRRNGEFCCEAVVAYDQDGIISIQDYHTDQPIEFNWLSGIDQELINKHLVLQLQSDEQERPEWWAV